MNPFIVYVRGVRYTIYANSYDEAMEILEYCIEYKCLEQPLYA